MKIELLRQSAFVITSQAGESIAVDLGSEVSQEAPARLKPTAALVSHLHPDHFHRPHLDALGAPVYGPPDVVAQLEGATFPVHVVRPGDRLCLAGMEVEAFAADHGPNISAMIDNLGFTFREAGKSILFLGDMAVETVVPGGPWDLVLIPVGCSKVFTPQEAATFLATLDHTGLVIPIHYHGRSDPGCGEAFRAIASAFSRVIVPAPGEQVAP